MFLNVPNLPKRILKGEAITGYKFENPPNFPLTTGRCRKGGYNILIEIKAWSKVSFVIG